MRQNNTTFGTANSFFEYDMGDRVLGRVGDRKVNGGRAGFVQQPFRFTRDRKGGHSVGVVQYFDIGPRYLAPPACFEGFQERLFRRETAGVALRRGGTARFAVLTFAGGEDAFGESRGSRDRLPYAVNFSDIDAYGKDHQ